MRAWSRRTVRQTFFQLMECQSGVRSGAAPASISAADISACLPLVGWPRFSRDGTPAGSQPAFAARGCRPWADSPSIRSITERRWLPPSSLLRCLISVLCSPPSLAGRQRGYFVHLLDRFGGEVVLLGRWW